jgi:outer membrane protein assembly factor BamB
MHRTGFRASPPPVAQAHTLSSRRSSSLRPVAVPLLACCGWIGWLISLTGGPAAAHAQEASPTCVQADWPLYRGDTRSSGRAAGRLPQQPDLLWQFDVPGGSFEATPIVADGRVLIGDLDGGVWGLSLADGQQLWHVAFPTGFASAAAYVQGRVILGDYDGLVRCLAADSGQLLWEFATGAQIAGGPIVDGAGVLITSEDGNLYRLAWESGQLEWTYETGDQLRCSPSVADGRTFLAGCDGKLHVVDVLTGEPAGTGITLPGPTGSTPAVAGAVVVVPVQTGAVLGYDRLADRQAWAFEQTQVTGEVRSCPAVTDTLTVLTGRNRNLLALSLEDGSMLWETKIRRRADGSPVICDGRVWVGGTDGWLYALELATGQIVWSREMPGGFLGSAAIAQNRLLIASDRGTLFCFGAQEHLD